MLSLDATLEYVTDERGVSHMDSYNKPCILNKLIIHINTKDYMSLYLFGT